MPAGQDGTSGTASNRLVRAASACVVLLSVFSGGLVMAAQPPQAPLSGPSAEMRSEPTPTPAQAGAGGKDGVSPPTGGGPITDLIPGAGSDSGLVTATITLEGPSGAEVFARFSAGGDARTSPRAALAAAWQAVRNLLDQRRLIAVLTAPDIGATVLGQSQLSANSITVQVNAAKLPDIRALPGVRSVTVNVPAGIDPIAPPQDQLDSGQQPPGDKIN